MNEKCTENGSRFWVFQTKYNLYVYLFNNQRNVLSFPFEAIKKLKLNCQFACWRVVSESPALP